MKTIERVGFDAVLDVANTGTDLDTGYVAGTLELVLKLCFDSEDHHVVDQITMHFETKAYEVEGAAGIQRALAILSGSAANTEAAELLPGHGAQERHHDHE